MNTITIHNSYIIIVSILVHKGSIGYITVQIGHLCYYMISRQVQGEAKDKC